MSESDRMERLEAFRTKDYGLRLSASRLAAMAGFHPFAVLPELLMTLVYQGGQDLLQHDTKLLGIQIRSEEVILMELAAKASKSTANALQCAFDVKKGKRVLDTVQVADQVKKKVLKEAKSSKKLNSDEIKLLQEGVRSSVDTGFGTFHEEDALDLYERQCGWQVRERNASIVAWPFAKAEDVDGGVQSVQQPTVVPMSEASAARRILETVSIPDTNKSVEGGEARKKFNTCDTDKSVTAEPNVDPSEIDDVMTDSDVPPDDVERRSESDKAMADLQALEKKGKIASLSHRLNRPFFTIYGAVDGIRDELWCPPSDGETSAFDEEWQLRQIIVECKHRMKRTFHSPPLYDQIQTTAYCLMYNVNEADILQVMRKPTTPSKTKMQKAATSCTSDAQPAVESKNDTIVPERTTANVSTENESGSAKNVIYCKRDSCMNDTKQHADEGEVDTEKRLESTQIYSESMEIDSSAIMGVAPPGNNAEQEQDETAKTEASTTSVEIDIKRVSLDDPLLQHRRNWNNIILPRLRLFVEAVYRIRSDDSKRYQLLAAMSDPSGKLSEAWNILHEECPWLKDCDTAFHRDY